jgi:hypothetical protein
MSWEAQRWTAKSPSELFHTFGPHGVDHLVRQALEACWRELPDDKRTLNDAITASREVFDRNVAVWKRIKRPEPAAFFADLQPTPADQFLRQAMVTCWMMMPRAGGRQLSDVVKIVTGIFERSISAWEADNATFTGKSAKKRSAPASKTAKKASSKTQKKSKLKKKTKR